MIVVGTKESLKVLQMGRDVTKMWLREGVFHDSVKKTEMEWIWEQKGAAWKNNQAEAAKDGSERI